MVLIRGCVKDGGMFRNWKKLNFKLKDARRNRFIIIFKYNNDSLIVTLINELQNNSLVLKYRSVQGNLK